ncbi:NAD(P)/FAD-dependent oxidoreductase [Salinibacterium sp. ZJ450]|uniref:NAD(P)/FAD-dependent oxidoreductase n=1 Tax=Salinibacterium sp. ZJ450 TaxID=2708338 RepID=UPI00141EA9B8|nr:FAD-dependent oxidoreductase [Salinibacterium sp. ZJ450]
MSTDTLVIVGGGLAGATAAQTLRADGFDGSILLFGAEPHLPYIRPPLSKEYMLGKAGRESVFVHPAAWYAEHDVDVDASTTVASIDPAEHRIRLADDRSIPYDRLLLATGATPRRVSVPGSTAHGIHYLRTVEDSERLHTALAGGGREVVLVGAGWIGLEIAAAAREFGNSVTAIGRETIPLQGPLGDELGGVFQRMHEEHGVRFRLPADLVGFSTSDDRVTGVMTDVGDLPADLVVVGIGAVPNTALAEQAGLDIRNGILVDQSLATSAPDVFAAGDVANAYHPVVKQHMRNEHWANAIASGKVAARSMRGTPAALDDIPYFYTDQYDLGMEYSGYPPLTPGARVVYRGDVAAREFIAFWLADDRVVAGMNVNVWDVNDQVQRLIATGRPVDVARLADPAVPLDELAAA